MQMGFLDKYVLYCLDVYGGEVVVLFVMGIMLFSFFVEYEWEILWYYMQGGFGVFVGDFYYYFVDGDFRNGFVDGYDIDECLFYLFIGEYDFFVFLEMIVELVIVVGVIYFEVMKGLGYFFMLENLE